MINWHQHSCYSYLDGASLPSDIVARCVELGMKHVMLTDHATCAGHLDMLRACKSAGVQAVLGTELYLKDDRYDNGKAKGWHLIVIAMNDEGLHNVWDMSSASYYATTDENRTPNSTWDQLEGKGSGVLCTSACLASMLSDAALKDDYDEADYFVGKCMGIFDEFAIELHTNGEPEQAKVNIWLAQYAKSRGLRCVYAVDSHYARKEDGDFHDVWLGMSTQSRYDEQHWTMRHDYYIQGEDEVRSRLAYLGDDVVDEAFENVDHYVGLFEPYTIDGAHKVPHTALPDGFESSNQYLVHLAVSGLLERVGGFHVSSDAPMDFKLSGGVAGACALIEPRLSVLVEKELPLVIDNGLADYFLMVAGYCGFARKNMLIGPGRGSCAGSELCYVLGITSVDPYGKGLIFERFLNQGRLGTWVVKMQDGRVYELGEAVTVLTDGGQMGVSGLKEGARVYAKRDWRGTPDESVHGIVGSVEFRGGELPDIDCDFQDDRRWMVERYLVDTYGEDRVAAIGTTSYYKMKSALHDICRYYRINMQSTLKLAAVVEQADEVSGKGVSWRKGLASLPNEDRELVAKYEADYPKMFVYAERMLGLCRQPGKHAAGYVVSPFSLSSAMPIRKAYSGHIGEVIGQFDKYQTEDLGFVKVDLLGLRNLTTLSKAAEMVERNSGVRVEFHSLVDSPDDTETWSLFDEGKTLGVFQMEGKGITAVAQALRPRSVMDVATVIALYRPGVIGAGMLDEALDRMTGKKPVEYLHPMLEPILAQSYGIVVFQEQAMQIFKSLGGFTDAEADQIRAAIGHKNLAQMQAMKPKYFIGCERNGIERSVAERIYSQVEASAGYSFNLSHAYCYATVAYWTAYMKAHYPAEFYAASMSTVQSDKVALYINEARKSGIRMVPPRVSSLARDYDATSPDEIEFGLIQMKGIGEKAIERITENAPYADFRDFVGRSGANSSVVRTLIDGGVFREWFENRRELRVRYDGGDKFEPTLFDAGGREYVSYDESRIAEMESEIYGIPLSVDPFRPYVDWVMEVGAASSLASSEDIEAAAVGQELMFVCQVTSVRQHVTKKKGQLMAFLTLMTSNWDSIEASVFPSDWAIARDWLQEGRYALLGVVRDEWNGRATWHVAHIRHFD